MFLLLGPLRDEDEQREHLLEVDSALTAAPAADAAAADAADAPVHHGAHAAAPAVAGAHEAEYALC